MSRNIKASGMLHPPPISLEQLQILETIARRGSFASAARALGKVPSALSYSVRKLEEELDVLLFDRRGRIAKPTDATKVLLAHSTQIFQLTERMLSQVKDLGKDWESELSIALDGSLRFEDCLALIKDFELMQIPTRLRVRHEVLEGSWEALAEGRVSLAIGMPVDTSQPSIHGSQFEVRSLGQLPWIFCMASTHPLAKTASHHGNNAEHLELDRLTAIAVADSAQQRLGRDWGILSHQARLTLASAAQKRAAILAGLGVGWMPEPYVRQDLITGSLIALDVKPQRQATAMRYAWSTRRPGKALAWWLSRLQTPRVRSKLLGGKSS
jgi:DNA-binding transcriptional LysR family regulator